MSERSSIDLTSDPLSIIGTRVLDAPRDLVFEVWTDPKHLAQWWGPDGFTTTTHQFDMREGGEWRFVMHGPDGRDYQNRVTYEEIRRPERIVYSHRGADDVEPVKFRSVVTFEALSESKTRVTLRGTFASPAERARVIREFGADKGMTQTLSRLGHYLDTQKENIMSAQTTEPVFTTSRMFDAPRALVWDAWTKAEHLARWFGPKGFEIVKCDLDLKPGGMFHYAMKSPDGKIMWGKWIFREIVKPEKLTVVTSFSDENAGVTRHPFSASWPLTTLSTTTLESVGNKTKMILNWWPLNPTEDERKTFAASMESMKQGWGGTMDQLADYLTRAQSGSHGKTQEHAMTNVNVYLHFDGSCGEAFALYEKVFKSKRGMTMTYGESPMPGQTPPEMKNKIMHTRLDIGKTVLMGSDAPHDRFSKPQGFSVSINCDTPEEADRVFNALSAGGRVDMPIQETFWAKRFAMFTDKFGTPWMVNCEKPMQ